MIEKCFAVRRAPLANNEGWGHHAVLYERRQRKDNLWIWGCVDNYPVRATADAALQDGLSSGHPQLQHAYDGGCATKLEDLLDAADVGAWRLGAIDLRIFMQNGKGRYSHYGLASRRSGTRQPFKLLCRVGSWTVKQNLPRSINIPIRIIHTDKLPRKVGKICSTPQKL